MKLNRRIYEEVNQTIDEGRMDLPVISSGSSLPEEKSFADLLGGVFHLNDAYREKALKACVKRNFPWYSRCRLTAWKTPAGGQRWFLHSMAERKKRAMSKGRTGGYDIIHT